MLSQHSQTAVTVPLGAKLELCLGLGTHAAPPRGANPGGQARPRERQSPNGCDGTRTLWKAALCTGRASGCPLAATQPQGVPGARGHSAGVARGGGEPPAATWQRRASHLVSSRCLHLYILPTRLAATAAAAAGVRCEARHQSFQTLPRSLSVRSFAALTCAKVMLFRLALLMSW